LNKKSDLTKGEIKMKKMLLVIIMIFCVLSAFGYEKWMLSFTTDKSYDEITFDIIKKASANFSTAKIEFMTGHYNSLDARQGEHTVTLKPGSILLFKTGEGNYGKMVIYAYSSDYWTTAKEREYFHNIKLAYTLYDSTGKTLKRISGEATRYIDFEGAQTEADSFVGADLKNIKDEFFAKLIPINGLKIMVAYRVW
jgi:hypothetical protein